MAKCGWHPNRGASAACDVCGRDICSDCASQLAERPHSCVVCPDCLDAMEHMVEGGLDSEAQRVSPRRAWLGAAVGCGGVLIAWLAAVSFIPPLLSVPLRWVGSLLCGVVGAAVAVRLTGNRRGGKVTLAAIGTALPSILVGYFLSANLILKNYLLGSPGEMAKLVDAGLLPPKVGWLLPMGLLRMVWESLAPSDLAVVLGMDAAVMLASLFLAHALTRKRRLWKSSPRTAT